MFDSSSLVLAFASDFLECAAIAFEHSPLAAQTEKALNHNVDVFRIEFYSVAHALSDFRGRERCAAAEKWVINQFAAPQVVQNRAPHQINWFLRRVVEFVLVRATHDELRDAETQIVEFSPGLPNHAAFFLRTYQQGSC